MKLTFTQIVNKSRAFKETEESLQYPKDRPFTDPCPEPGESSLFFFSNDIPLISILYSY
jgi:hypothetical protein